MRNEPIKLGRVSSLAAAVAATLPLSTLRAQEAPDPAPQPIEEVVATYRLLSAAESLTDERINLPFSADFLGSDVIARAGDSDIAAALRRVPGLTLIDGKFVYVRGLGERYSSVTVNGAAVPSPDLTRSVIPLDLFPTSIVESIKIQKSPSPDQPAAFGGGTIDIRTSSVPQEAVASFEIGLGYNNESRDDGLTYADVDGGLPAPIRQAIDAYRGDISVSRIFSTLRESEPLVPISAAQQIHQGLMDSLNTDVGMSLESLDPDLDAKLALGNAWDVGDSWRIGVLMNATYGRNFRNEDQHREGVGNPTRNFLDIERTIESERTVGALNLGLDYLDDHTFELGSYVIQDDEDLASISRGFDANNQFPDQKLNYSTRFQERRLRVNQISGTHTFQDTPGLTNALEGVNLRDLEFDWFYSESKAETDIPNQTDFQASALLNDAGEIQSTQLLATTTSGQFSYLELDDNLDSWGGNFSLPIDGDRMYVTLSGGWWGSQKSRSYYGYNVNLNSVGVPSSVLNGGPGDVLRPDRLTVANGFDLSLGTQFGTESYVGAQQVDAGYGMADFEFGPKWRFTAGVRYESYEHAVLPIDLLDFSGRSITNLRNQLSDPNQRLAVAEDDAFPSLALTRIGDGVFGSEQFQVRLSYGETVVRPDLREIADVIYIDPELDVRVRGNPFLQSSPIDNFELRSEFFYGNGDNFTVSLFYKDIQSPIEQIRSAGSDDDFVLGFANAETGEVYGVEFEGLKQLWRGLFLAGNLTLSDSELQFSPGLSSDLTNLTRRLTGHSEWVLNTTLGYDSDNGRHSAYLNYNAFGERIFFAGTGLNEDAYEQPFNSLGVVYKYFPTDRLEVGVEIDNILDEQAEYEQVNRSGQTARIISQRIGTSFGLSANWSF
jgi:outer membrane receptor protein involved in Fe transport